MTSIQHSKLIPPKEAAARLGVSIGTLAKWRMDGVGPSFVKLNSKIAYDEKMLEAWITSRVRRSTQEKGA